VSGNVDHGRPALRRRQRQHDQGQLPAVRALRGDQRQLGLGVPGVDHRVELGDLRLKIVAQADVLRQRLPIVSEMPVENCSNVAPLGLPPPAVSRL
jgi:hypothetical protein